MARDYLMFFRNRTSPAASSRAASDGAALWCCLRLGGLFLFLSRVGRPELAARIQEQAVGLYKPVGIFHGVAPCQLLDLHCGNQRDRVGVLACTPCLDGYLPVVDARGLAAVVEPEARGRVLACGRRGKPRAAQGGRVLQVLGEGIGLAGPCGLPAVAARGRCEGNGSTDGDECILHFSLLLAIVSFSACKINHYISHLQHVGAALVAGQLPCHHRRYCSPSRGVPPLRPMAPMAAGALLRMA